ncbi:hypothetical protein CEXT_216391 [Caerostris extrusa]|uniref:Uncharacterized protein n=1 Tax=Caerostris extrusa TaxID=172846 RepID=A0AAV4Y0J6_CAEEX|nr:hypothetical protein CEXT_216391 [Caerostris extrusa]
MVTKSMDMIYKMIQQSCGVNSQSRLMSDSTVVGIDSQSCVIWDSTIMWCQHQSRLMSDSTVVWYQQSVMCYMGFNNYVVSTEAIRKIIENYVGSETTVTANYFIKSELFRKKSAYMRQAKPKRFCFLFASVHACRTFFTLNWVPVPVPKFLTAVATSLCSTPLEREFLANILY